MLVQRCDCDECKERRKHVTVGNLVSNLGWNFAPCFLCRIDLKSAVPEDVNPKQRNERHRTILPACPRHDIPLRCCHTDDEAKLEAAYAAIVTSISEFWSVQSVVGRVAR